MCENKLFEINYSLFNSSHSAGGGGGGGGGGQEVGEKDRAKIAEIGVSASGKTRWPRDRQRMGAEKRVAELKKESRAKLVRGGAMLSWPLGLHAH